ncbi:MAG: tryptophan--tRNA ligase [Bacteroidetes bacterium]|nr:tryptophan--tRNA ligase [Bacteroidota bacterium]
METSLNKADIVVSGVRPSGKLTIGNYFGAIRNFVKLQESCDQIFCFLADIHTLTTHSDPVELKNSVKLTTAIYLGCGLDPNKVNIYAQSEVREISELYLYLNMLAYMGELEKTAAFKDKIRKHADNINAGLLTYPVLMAADVLIHKGTKVPVGKDQIQHIEMMRDFGSRFNFRYQKNIFPEPQPFSFGEEPIKIPSLGGSGKMDKSGPEDHAIFLIDDDKAIEKKIKRAVTDTGPTEKNSVKPESIENLFYLMELVSEKSVVADFNARYNDSTIRYGDFKKQLAEDMIQFVRPVRERILEFYHNDKLLLEVTNKGADAARKSAQKTMKEVREVMGLK